MEDPGAAIDLPQVAFKKRSSKGKATIRKRPATPPPESDSDSSFVSSDDEQGHRIKRRKNNAGVTASSANQQPSREQDIPVPLATSRPTQPSDVATKASNWYDEEDKAPMRSRELLGTTRSKAGEGESKPGVYTGAANYQSFIQKNPNAPTKQVGPVKASTNVRTITVTDYSPDVCKDYKQTGFCGFGDSCKFLHAREDYKQGWELDRDWEVGTKGKKVVGRTVASANRSIGNEAENEDDDALLESIPFACIICKKAYNNPIVTKCGHYFCEACALQRYRKNPSCAVCGTGTGGVFNVAKKLNRILEKKRERKAKRREQALERGEAVSEDESDEA
ncbi:MAG: hypothetical protein Q9227_003073 [Pyrenula ochraceoflavens]